VDLCFFSRHEIRKVYIPFLAWKQSSSSFKSNMTHAPTKKKSVRLLVASILTVISNGWKKYKKKSDFPKVKHAFLTHLFVRYSIKNQSVACI
jgi:hypothetical protein